MKLQTITITNLGEFKLLHARTIALFGSGTASLLYPPSCLPRSSQGIYSLASAYRQSVYDALVP